MSCAVLGLALTTVLGCSEEDDAAEATCESLCARTIGCPNDPDAECATDCNIASAACPAQNQAFIDCASAAPDSQLACDASGETNLGPNICQAELAALRTCVMAL